MTTKSFTDKTGCETWLNSANMPFYYHISPVCSFAQRCTSKELDTQTHLYYFGARYYDPKTSLWVSTDPILGRYLDGKGGDGGFYNSKNLGLYTYCHNTPVLKIDLFGLSAVDPIDIYPEVNDIGYSYDLETNRCYQMIDLYKPECDRNIDLDFNVGIGQINVDIEQLKGAFIGAAQNKELFGSGVTGLAKRAIPIYAGICFLNSSVKIAFSDTLTPFEKTFGITREAIAAIGSYSGSYFLGPLGAAGGGILGSRIGLAGPGIVGGAILGGYTGGVIGKEVGYGLFDAATLNLWNSISEPLKQEGL